jgi:hypothetical protein
VIGLPRERGYTANSTGPERYESGALAALRELLDRPLALQDSGRAAPLDAAQIEAQIVALFENLCNVHLEVTPLPELLGEGVTG